MIIDSVQKLNEVLTDMTIISRLEFDVDLVTGHCSVVLELQDDNYYPQNQLALVFKDVKEMNIHGFGGGITQVKCLRMRSLRSLQHDRKGFALEELEENALSLVCNTWSSTLVHVFRNTLM